MKIIASYKPSKAQQDMTDRRYGMFIHFGINTFNDTEWSDGTLSVSSYNPTALDVDGWIKNAKDCGMTYVILITKHHDGFCLFETETTDYCVGKSPCPIDVVAEAAKACAKYGVKLGLYYSLWDRHEKCYSDNEKYVGYMLKHFDELLGGRYGEICELWLDGGWDKKPKDWHVEQLYYKVKELQPNCAVSINWTIGNPRKKGGAVKKYYPAKHKNGMPIKYFPSDFRMADPFFTSEKGDGKFFEHDGEWYYLPFEATICIRNMRNWFWDPQYTAEKLVPTEFIVKKYKQARMQKNCLVVNVAPNTDGKQEQSDIDRLLEVARILGIGKYADSAKNAAECAVIPKPVKMSLSDGTVGIGTNTDFGGDFKTSADYAKKLFTAQNETRNECLFIYDENLAHEEYKVECDGDIKIYAADEAGAFYALMSLKQLEKNGRLPEVVISDKPKYAYRGFMLDSARHFWSVEKVKQILDVSASVKLNVFHWHLTDDQGWRIEIKKYPLLTEKGSVRKSTQIAPKRFAGGAPRRDDREYGKGLFYTQEEIKEIVSYAAERHIEVIPEIDMPGHMTAAIACYPELSCARQPVDVADSWGVKDDIACCGNENVYGFIKDVIDEVAPLFGSRYFHIGGDEVPKKRPKACPKCQAVIRGQNLSDENALQGYFNYRVAEYLEKHGKTVIGWNEILDVDYKIYPNSVVQWWTYHKNSGEKELAFLNNGGKAVLSLCDYVYMDHPYSVRPLEKTYSYCPEVMGITDATNVLGIEAPQWTEYVRDNAKFDINTYARLITVAEIAWAEKESYAAFEKRFELLREYFEGFGVELAWPEVYRGHSVGKIVAMFGAGWRRWRKNPYCEVGYQNRLKGTFIKIS